MIEVKGYQCEHCGDLFEEQATCKAHESEHITTDQLEMTGALHHNDNDVLGYNFDLMAGRFPHKLFIEKKDFSGTAARYTLDRAGPVEEIYTEEYEAWMT